MLMHRTLKLFIVINFSFVFLANGQLVNLSSLAIGDHVPDVWLGNMQNYTSDHSKLSQFENKLVILDFWNKYCTACIHAFPKMEELQKKFDGKIQILLVTENNIDDLKHLIKYSPTVRNTKLPMVLSDTILHKLFPHNAEPFIIWLDTQRKIVAATQSTQATPENISMVLDGQPLSSLKMREDQLDFNLNTPLILEGNGRQWKHMGYYSMIMKKADGSPKSMSGMIHDPLTDKSIEGSMRFLNRSLRSLYSYAYDIPGDYTIVEDDDPTSFYHSNDLARINEADLDEFNYEIVMPPERKDQLKLFMQQDLERYFGWVGVSETRKVSCYVLYRTNDTIDRLKTKGEAKISEPKKNGCIIRNGVMQDLIYMLQPQYRYLYIPPIIIDETGYSEHLDIELNSQLPDIVAVRKDLSVYGIGIKTEEREVQCLVLKKNKFWLKTN